MEKLEKKMDYFPKNRFKLNLKWILPVFIIILIVSLLYVNFIKKLRNEIFFSDVHALIDQLEKDKIDSINIVKKYLK